MSRIGFKPINIPSGVEVELDNNLIKFKGPKGNVEGQLNPEMEVIVEDNVITVNRPSEKKNHKSLHGLTRSLINNMLEGVVTGYSKALVIEGTGYRAQKQGNKLILNLGYSHPIEMEEPEGIEIEVPKANEIIIKGADKQKVGSYAAVIRDLRKPEPYKGKGIKYADEIIRRKVGKIGK